MMTPFLIQTLFILVLPLCVSGERVNAAFFSCMVFSGCRHRVRDPLLCGKAYSKFVLHHLEDTTANRLPTWRSRSHCSFLLQSSWGVLAKSHHLSSKPFPLLLAGHLDYGVEQSHSSSESFQIENENPYSPVWHRATSSCSILSTSIRPVVRPPSSGGAGIIAVADIPANTTLIELPLGEGTKIDVPTVLPLFLGGDDDDDSNQDNNDASSSSLAYSSSPVARAIQKFQSDGTEASRVTAFTGLVSQLHLCRLQQIRREEKNVTHDDVTKDTTVRTTLGGAVETKFGPFLDSLPFLPPLRLNQQYHPFPTHVLHWSDDEIEHLLCGTIAQTKARMVRAGAGSIVAALSSSFIQEYCHNDNERMETASTWTISRQDILSSLISSYSIVLSRSFGDEMGKDTNENGRCLLPLLDLLNHNGTEPNVQWKLYVGTDAGPNGTIVVKTIRNVRRGEELFKDYGWRPGWDWGANYGFLPMEECETLGEDDCRYKECLPDDATAVPLFPMTELDTIMKAGVSMNQFVDAVLTAVRDASRILQQGRGAGGESAANDGGNNTGMANHDFYTPEVVHLFRKPLKSSTSRDGLVLQPCVVIRHSACIQKDVNMEQTIGGESAIRPIKKRLEFILLVFGAAASALDFISRGEEMNVSDMARAAASLDGTRDSPVVLLVESGIRDRIDFLRVADEETDAWLCSYNASMMEPHAHLRDRALVARQIRNRELLLLRSLQQVLAENGIAFI